MDVGNGEERKVKFCYKDGNDKALKTKIRCTAGERLLSNIIIFRPVEIFDV